MSEPEDYELVSSPGEDITEDFPSLLAAIQKQEDGASINQYLELNVFPDAPFEPPLSAGKELNCTIPSEHGSAAPHPASPAPLSTPACLKGTSPKTSSPVPPLPSSPAPVRCPTPGVHATLAKPGPPSAAAPSASSSECSSAALDALHSSKDPPAAAPACMPPLVAPAVASHQQATGHTRSATRAPSPISGQRTGSRTSIFVAVIISMVICHVTEPSAVHVGLLCFIGWLPYILHFVFGIDMDLPAEFKPSLFGGKPRATRSIRPRSISISPGNFTSLQLCMHLALFIAIIYSAAYRGFPGPVSSSEASSTTSLHNPPQRTFTTSHLSSPTPPGPASSSPSVCVALDTQGACVASDYAQYVQHLQQQLAHREVELMLKSHVIDALLAKHGVHHSYQPDDTVRLMPPPVHDGLPGAMHTSEPTQPQTHTRPGVKSVGQQQQPQAQAHGAPAGQEHAGGASHAVAQQDPEQIDRLHKWHRLPSATALTLCRHTSGIASASARASRRTALALQQHTASATAQVAAAVHRAARASALAVMQQGLSVAQMAKRASHAVAAGVACMKPSALESPVGMRAMAVYKRAAGFVERIVAAWKWGRKVMHNTRLSVIAARRKLQDQAGKHLHAGFNHVRTAAQGAKQKVASRFGLKHRPVQRPHEKMEEQDKVGPAGATGMRGLLRLLWQRRLRA